MLCNINSHGNAYNTSYYSRTKKERFRVNTCPYCDYESTGPKQVIKSHIWAKHTAESERPYQCPHVQCQRGYAAKATLYKHIKKSHNISMPKKYLKDILVLEISINNTINIEQLCPKYRKRMDIYQNNRFIPINMLDKLSISRDDIYFDRELNYIQVIEHSRAQLLKRFILIN